MTHLVFSQLEGPGLPVDALRRQAAAWFAAELSVIETKTEPVQARFAFEQGARLAVFDVAVRPASPADHERSTLAEQRGQATGMATLARRCPIIWVVEAEPGAPEGLLWLFCALLASVALGPILPPEDDTLLGVRSARARAERADSDARDGREPLPLTSSRPLGPSTS